MRIEKLYNRAPLMSSAFSTQTEQIVILSRYGDSTVVERNAIAANAWVPGSGT
jgi:hypothetical protein